MSARNGRMPVIALGPRWRRIGRGGLVILAVALAAGCAWPGRAPVTPVSAPPEEPAPRIEVREFILGPRDEIEVFVWQHPDLTRTVVVDPSGHIGFPLVGKLKASGVGGEELATRIRDGLSRYVIDPKVTVTVKTARSEKILVLGEVNKAGVFPLEGPTRAIEAIALAGGFNVDAEPASVLLIRGNLENPELRTITLDRALRQGTGADNVLLQPGDVVYVPATRIANAERFMKRISNILIPFVAALQGVIFLPR